MIPLYHDFADETVLVFGGGAVGARKARRFDAEARVLVCSPTPADHDFGDAQLVRAEPDPAAVGGWLDAIDHALVVAATDDDAMNEAIVECAARRDILRNHADRSGGDRDVGSVVVPSTLREDPVVVGVATGGTAPIPSKHLRQRLEDELAGAGEMVRLLGELRTTLDIAGISAERRQEILKSAVTDPPLWTALRSGEVNRADVIEDVLERADAGGDPA